VSWELRPRGFATLVIALSFLSGIQLVVISLLGEYIIRIFKETKQRPLYVVKEARNVELPPEDETLGVVASSSLGSYEEE
jgi:dolichol-phosphate mannosyltransferase